MCSNKIARVLIQSSILTISIPFLISGVLSYNISRGQMIRLTNIIEKEQEILSWVFRRLSVREWWSGQRTGRRQSFPVWIACKYVHIYRVWFMYPLGDCRTCRQMCECNMSTSKQTSVFFSTYWTHVKITKCSSAAIKGNYQGRKSPQQLEECCQNVDVLSNWSHWQERWSEVPQRMLL